MKNVTKFWIRIKRMDRHQFNSEMRYAGINKQFKLYKKLMSDKLSDILL